MNKQSKNYSIYIIRNEQSERCYYGLTKRAVLKRKQCHFHLLRKGKHDNRHLQSAFNKYGPQAFTFNVYAAGLTQVQAINLERMLIAIDQNSYNIVIGGDCGSVESEEWKESIRKRGKRKEYIEKQSKAQLQRFDNESRKYDGITFRNRNSGEVYQLGSPYRFAKYAEIPRNHVYSLIWGKKKSYKGWELWTQN